MSERMCDDCLGLGARYSVKMRIMWPCPHCEGRPHPSTGPEFIRVHAVRSSTP